MHSPRLLPESGKQARSEAVKLEPGGGTPREIADVLPAPADAPARSPVRLLHPHAAAILAEPAVRTVREDRYDCHHWGRALYRTRDTPSMTRCRRSGRHLQPRPASRMPAGISTRTPPRSPTAGSPPSPPPLLQGYSSIAPAWNGRPRAAPGTADTDVPAPTRPAAHARSPARPRALPPRGRARVPAGSR